MFNKYLRVHNGDIQVSIFIVSGSVVIMSINCNMFSNKYKSRGEKCIKDTGWYNNML